MSLKRIFYDGLSFRPGYRFGKFSKLLYCRIFFGFDADNLTGAKFETIGAAIGDYEQQMFVYAGAAQRESSLNELEMRSPEFSFQQLII